MASLTLLADLLLLPALLSRFGPPVGDSSAERREEASPQGDADM